MEDVQSEIVVLGDAVLDLGRGTLTRDGQVLPLRAKAFRLLRELALNPGRVMSKDELLDAVWPDVTVGEDSLTQAVREIRRVLGDDGTVLRTVARRGYLLVPDRVAETPVFERPARVGATLPRIAVLPLVNATGDPAPGPLLDGLVEEITNGLARFRNLTVVARHSAFAAAREGLDLGAMGARLRADYLVDGTARFVDGQPRLSLALNDTASGEVLWGGGFDGSGSGWLTLQDLVPRQIVAQLFRTIEDAGHRRSLRRGSTNMNAFEHLARGKALFRSYEPGVNERARAEFAAAIAADPSFGIAHTYHAHAELALHDYELAPLEVKQRVKAEAMRGVELSPDEAHGHSFLGYMHMLLEEWEAAEREATHAVALNPCDADALIYLAWVLMGRGADEAALSWIERAKEINPLSPGYYDSGHSEALFFLGRYEESARILLRLPRLSARQEMRLAATYALMGNREAARQHATRAGDMEPEWDFVAKARDGYQRERPTDLQRLLDGIELALRALEES